MPRRRLGVVLLVPEPEAAAVDGLRRAMGTDVHRIAPHITLVPPVNVREDDLETALSGLRSAAAATSPFELHLGPVRSFAPVSPVVYLAISGDIEPLHGLRAGVFQAPLSRPLSHGFHPHLTLGEDIAPERTAAAVAALASFEATVRIDALHLLEEQREDDGRRVWRPLADVRLAASSVVARGGLDLELTVGHRPDPDGARLLAGADGARPLTVTARRDGAVIGVISGAVGEPCAWLDTVTVAEGHRREGVGRQMLAAFEVEAARAGASLLTVQAATTDPVLALCRSRGWVDTARLVDRRGRAVDVLHRQLT